MLYRITASSLWSSDNILDHYPCLNDFGYRLVEHKTPHGAWIKDETGLGRLWQDLGYKTIYIPYIEINSLEELDKLQESVKQPLIYGGADEPEIEIYDSYRE